MAVSRIQVTEGGGKNIATYDFSESSVTKELQRIVVSTSSGTESGTSGSPFVVSIGSQSLGKTLKTATGTVSATTTIVAAVTSKRIKVQSYALLTSSTTAVTATFRSASGGTALWTIPMQATSGAVFGANLATQCPAFLFATNAGELLELGLSGAVSVTYSITYWDDDNS
jgi:hypothetical protein